MSASTAASSTNTPRSNPLTTAQLWEAVLDQDTYWVPRGAWSAYAAASTLPYRVVPTFENVDGVTKIAEMDRDWLQTLIPFLWRRARSIVFGRAAGIIWEPGLNGAPDDVLNYYERDAARYDNLVNDETKRREWFDAKPFVIAVKAKIVNDTEKRSRRGPVILDVPQAPPTTTPSGLHVPSHVLAPAVVPPAAAPSPTPAACPGWGEEHPTSRDSWRVGDVVEHEVCNDCVDDEPADSCASCGGYHLVTYNCYSD